MMFICWTKNTEISKSLNVSRALVARWIKSHQSFNVLREPDDDNEITEILREEQKIHSNVGCRCEAGHLQGKGAKAKKVRLRLILKYLKKKS